MPKARLAYVPTIVGRSRLVEKPGFHRRHAEIRNYGITKREWKFFLYTASPIKGDDGTVKSVIIERFPATKVLAVTDDYSGLGKTGEIVLGEKKGDQIQILTPSRLGDQSKQPPPVLLSEGKAVPMFHATSGETGIIIDRDYRGMQVVSGFAPLNIPGWGLVAKQDKSEVFSKANELGVILIVSVVLLIVTGLWIMTLLTGALTKPVEKLIGAISILGKSEDIPREIRRKAPAWGTEGALYLLSAVAESTQDAIIGETLDGVITSWNLGAEALYGYSAKEVIGKPVAILVPPEHTDEIRQHLEAAGSGQEIRGHETVRLTKRWKTNRCLRHLVADQGL